MPILELTLNRSISEDAESGLLDALARAILAVKPEVQLAGIMVSIVQGAVSYGGDGRAPAGHARLTNAKMPPEVTRALTERITSLVCEATSIDPMRFYIQFWTLADNDHVSIGGRTFAQMALGGTD